MPNPAGLGRGAATSYVLGDKSTLLRSSPSIQNGGTDTCWVVATDDQKLAFTTSFFGDGRISSYELDETGLVCLIEPVATTAGDDSSANGVEMGAGDLALSSDSAYLYQNNSIRRHDQFLRQQRRRHANQDRDAVLLPAARLRPRAYELQV